MRRFVLSLVLAAAPAAAQPAADGSARPAEERPAARAAESVDVQMLRSVYSAGAPLSTVFRTLDRTSYPAFVAVPAGLYAYAVATDGQIGPSVRAAASEAAATLLVMGAKNVVRRPRPYTVVPGIVARTGGTHPRASMPSGHSALAFAAATSVALDHPKAAVPALGWATGVALGRVWHGVHYPSDILAGAAVGAGTAYVVHRLVTDDRFFAKDEAAATASAAVPLGTLRLRF